MLLQSEVPNSTLHFIYEAGPCGYWIYRLLTKLNEICYVIAPSLIPKKSGDRVKTDKRDSIAFAKHLKNGDLTPVTVSAAEDEAIHDLSRARERSMHDLNDARFQLKALLIRNHVQYEGTANGSKKICVG